MFFMGTSINNIKTRASREMTSQTNIKIFYFNGVNVAKHWHLARYLPSLIALLIYVLLTDLSASITASLLTHVSAISIIGFVLLLGFMFQNTKLPTLLIGQMGAWMGVNRIAN